MANAVNRLSAKKVQALKEPGRHADGGGLYLVVDPSGARRWVMLYRLSGRRREMGLGSAASLMLADAREQASQARRQIALGLDPIDQRKSTTPKRVITFADVATSYMADHAKSWRNAAHREQWRQTLEVQAAELWKMPVDAIETQHVLALLRPIWHEKPETARRIRGRVERVLDAARAANHRQTENPARWRAHLEMLLPRNQKLSRGHHAAMPYAQVPAFMAQMTERNSASALALRFAIFTAARSGEVRGMTWDEIDGGAAVWIVPADRMKSKRVHRVPLPSAALDLLEIASVLNPDRVGLIFPGAKPGSSLSDMSLSMCLRKAGYADVTVHGFRSSFRDWVDSETDFAGDLAEAALAHLTGDKTERAYRRGDALERRRHLMDAWALFVASASSDEANSRSSSE